MDTKSPPWVWLKIGNRELEKVDSFSGQLREIRGNKVKNSNEKEGLLRQGDKQANEKQQS